MLVDFKKFSRQCKISNIPRLLVNAKLMLDFRQKDKQYVCYILN